MLCTDRFIVFNYTRFSDSSIILHVLSQQHGRLSVMVFGLGGKGKSKLGAFHPFSLIDAVYSLKGGREIQKLKEYKINPPLTSCVSDIRKSTLMLFLSEVTSKCIHEESADQHMFHFIETSIEMLDHIQVGLSWFHLAYLIKLSRYLGFSPDSDGLSLPFFDLILGHGMPNKPAHQHFLNQPLYKKFYQLFTMAYDQLGDITWNHAERDVLMQATLDWYGFHMPGLKNIQSYSVLREVFAV